MHPEGLEPPIVRVRTESFAIKLWMQKYSGDTTMKLSTLHKGSITGHKIKNDIPKKNTFTGPKSNKEGLSYAAAKHPGNSIMTPGK